MKQLRVNSPHSPRLYDRSVCLFIKLFMNTKVSSYFKQCYGAVLIKQITVQILLSVRIIKTQVNIKMTSQTTQFFLWSNSKCNEKKTIDIILAVQFQQVEFAEVQKC
uniref:Uncharacterized protein n=1 Tax=Onchocerca volvulus TaxID=6282 RepID=A0A8R1TYV8_ONCVO